MAELTLKKIKKEVEELEELEEKKEYLEKVLKETKDDKLKKDIEKLLKEINELLEAKEKTASGLERKFTTSIPAPELPPAPEEPKIAATRAAAPTELEEQSPAEKYVRPRQQREELITARAPAETYRLNVDYIQRTDREAIHDIVTKYLRAEGLKPEDFARSPELQRRAAEKAQELLGETTDLYTIRGQVQYEAQKAAHPEFGWERDPEGWIKYKSLKGLTPKLMGEE